MTFLFRIVVVALVLLIDPLLSFTTISSKRRASPRRSSSPPISSIDIHDDASTENHPALGRISLSSSPLRLSMTRQRPNSNFYDDDDNNVDDYYDEKEEKEMDYAADDYDSTSYYEEAETTNDGSTKGNSRRRDSQKRRTSSSAPDDNNYYDDDEDVVLNSDDDEDDNGSGRGRGGYYRVSFNEEVDPSETEIDWEVCTSSSDGKTQALVLLPPAAVERPTAIIHFVGGTFFGSNPKLWYRSLLESIVRSTSAAIVVTPIPVTLFKNPLQHVRLSQKLQTSFKHAWFTVLEDEYGSDILQDIPLCGLGHSLGARLLTVMTTLNQNVPLESDRRGRTETASIPPYKSMCLISFTNYGAKVGIPGVAALRKQSKKREQTNNKRSGGRKSNNRNSYYDRYDDNYDPDEEWAELVEELQETVSEQANRIQTALTPNAKDLEFVPSPDRLWKAMKEDGRYNVNTTLVVQFDDDPIDQSSQLAQALHGTNSSDVRFARLRGNHLTPVSVTDDNHDDDNGNGNNETGGDRSSAQRRLRRQTSAGKLGSVIEQIIKGNNKNRRDKIAMRDLRSSIISYITDVVTK
jgi:hypothetical protein